MMMKSQVIVSLSVLISVLSAVYVSAAVEYGAVAVLRGTAANPLFSGVALFSQPKGAGSAVQIDITIFSSAVNGSFAIHVHQWGDIRDAAGALAGSHFNPTNTSHACYPSASRHVGDLLQSFNYNGAPNTAQTLSIQRDLMDLSDTANSIIGRAVIVHALPDNCQPPTGAAGTFIAQGVIGVYGTPRANAVLSSPPASAVAVLFPTATYLLRSLAQPSVCFQLVSDAGATPSVSTANCYDRRSLLFWGGPSSSASLTSVVGAALPQLQFLPSGSSLQQYKPVEGQLRNATDSTCFSSTTGKSGFACYNVEDQQFVLSPAMPSLTGTLQFAVDPSTKLVRVRANITGLLPSTSGYQLGLHVHQYGNEYAAAGAVNAASAGGHFDPANTNHHDLPPATPRHMGDLGFFAVSPSGVLLGEVELNVLSLTAKDGNILGRGVVLHVWTDNGSQPTGAAQGRIALGVIGVSSTTLGSSQLVIRSSSSSQSGLSMSSYMIIVGVALFVLVSSLVLAMWCRGRVSMKREEGNVQYDRL